MNASNVSLLIRIRMPPANEWIEWAVKWQAFNLRDTSIPSIFEKQVLKDAFFNTSHLILSV